MHDAVVNPLAAWESFYVIVGSSGAALTGLMFVVITLIADVGGPGGHPEVGAFGTPTVVHFCAVLLLAAILSAPWPSLASAGLALGVTGVAGVLYTFVVLRRARRATGYKPVLEDWLFHAVLPFAAYATVSIAAIALRSRPAASLFGVAAASLLLLFVGIHNAWDTVTYVAFDPAARRRARRPEPEAAAADVVRDAVPSSPD